MNCFEDDRKFVYIVFTTDSFRHRMRNVYSCNVGVSKAKLKLRFPCIICKNLGHKRSDFHQFGCVVKSRCTTEVKKYLRNWWWPSIEAGSAWSDIRASCHVSRTAGGRLPGEQEPCRFGKDQTAYVRTLGHINQLRDDRSSCNAPWLHWFCSHDFALQLIWSQSAHTCTWNLVLVVGACYVCLCSCLL